MEAPRMGFIYRAAGSFHVRRECIPNYDKWAMSLDKATFFGSMSANWLANHPTQVQRLRWTAGVASRGMEAKA